jgi:hypothetical protein
VALNVKEHAITSLIQFCAAFGTEYRESGFLALPGPMLATVVPAARTHGTDSRSRVAGHHPPSADPRPAAGWLAVVVREDHLSVIPETDARPFTASW